MEFIIIDAALFDLLIEKLNRLAGEADNIRNGKDAVLEPRLDGQEVCEILGVTKRTLQTLRDTGRIAYSMVSHKVYYRPEDVQILLNNNFKNKSAL